VQGFLNLNKPADWTSHDCVAKVRRILRLKKVGHGGTLDPAATGVLPIALGRATRLLQYLPADKAYRATVRFGVTTTTDDLDGEIITQPAAPQLTLADVQAVLPQFQGTIEQIPPRYSAIQVEGKRLYDLARTGQSVDVPQRTVHVHKIKILNWRDGEFPELDLAIACGAGTYIRAIARDLGDVLQTGATLASLIRTKSSGFTLNTSIALEQLQEQVNAEQWQPLPADAGLQHLPILVLEDLQAQAWQQGQKLSTSDSVDNSTTARTYDATGQFLGISQVHPSEAGIQIKPKVVLLPA
jgi:tRNA pseudouridine55 synthase